MKEANPFHEGLAFSFLTNHGQHLMTFALSSSYEEERMSVMCDECFCFRYTMSCVRLRISSWQCVVEVGHHSAGDFVIAVLRISLD
jgi:hypothetical protein